MITIRQAEPESTGLDALVAGLLSAAAEDPAKAQVIQGMRGSVHLVLTDLETDLRLLFDAGQVVVAVEDRPSDVRLRLTSETMLGLASVPRWGVLPRFTTPEGRKVYGQLRRRELRVRGISHLRLLKDLMAVLTTA